MARHQRWALVGFFLIAFPLRSIAQQLNGRLSFGQHLAFLLSGAVVAAAALLIAFARAPEDGRTYLGAQLRRKTRRLLAWTGGLAGSGALLAVLTNGTTVLDGPTGDPGPVDRTLFTVAGGLLVLTVVGTGIGLLLTLFGWSDPHEGG